MCVGGVGDPLIRKVIRNQSRSEWIENHLLSSAKRVPQKLPENNEKAEQFSGPVLTEPARFTDRLGAQLPPWGLSPVMHSDTAPLLQSVGLYWCALAERLPRQLTFSIHKWQSFSLKSFWEISIVFLYWISLEVQDSNPVRLFSRTT